MYYSKNPRRAPVEHFAVFIDDDLIDSVNAAYLKQRGEDMFFFSQLFLLYRRLACNCKQTKFSL